MSSTSPPDADHQTSRIVLESAESTRSEHCPECNSDTEHTVTVAIRNEGNNTTTSDVAAAREPYRIATCSQCGHETSARC